MSDTVKAVFNKIAALSERGGYIIAERDELAAAADASAAEIGEALDILQRGGFIDIKYNRGGVYCLTALKKRLPEEQPPEVKIQQPPSETQPAKKSRFAFNVKSAAFLFLSSLIGGAIGSAAVCLAFLAG